MKSPLSPAQYYLHAVIANQSADWCGNLYLKKMHKPVCALVRNDAADGIMNIGVYCPIP